MRPEVVSPGTHTLRWVKGGAESTGAQRGEVTHTQLLAGGSNWQVILVGNDADLIHEADLLLIVAVQGIAAGVDIGEQPQDSFRRNRLRDGLGGCGRHPELFAEVQSR